LFIEPGGHTARVNQVVFTPDGRELVSAGNDKGIRFWDLATRETVETLRGQIGPGPGGEIHAIAMHPNGRLLAVGGYPAGTARREAPVVLYDRETGEITRLLRGHTRNVTALAFSRDGSVLASASGDDTVILWDAATGKRRRVLRGHRADVYGVAFAPDGRRVASASHDSTVRVWSVADGRQVWQAVHARGVQCVAWSPDGRTVASGSLDQTIRLWDADAGQPLWTSPSQGAQVECLAFSPDGTQLASGLGGDPRGRDFPISLWSLPIVASPRRIARHRTAVMSLAFAPGGSAPLLASAGEEAGEVFLWDPRTGEEQGQLSGVGATPWSVAWAADGTRVAWSNTPPATVGSGAPLQRTFDLPKGWPGSDVAENEPWVRATKEHPATGRRLDYAEPVDDERLGVTVFEGERAVVRIPRNSRQAHDQVRCFTFTPRGEIVVGSLFTLALYDAGGRRRREFVGHTGQILDVAVSPDGKFLASAGLDQAIRIWPLAGGGRRGKVAPLLSLFMATNREWVSWTPEGYYACSPSGDQLVGWHMNRGVYNAAAFYTAYQLRRVFFWPALVRRVLPAGSTARALQLARQEAPRGSPQPVPGARELPAELKWTERPDIRKLLPPTVKILKPTPNERLTGSEVTVRVQVISQGAYPLKKPIEIRVANRLRGKGPLKQEHDPKVQGTVWSQRVAIQPGEWISAIAENSAGAETVQVRGFGWVPDAAARAATPDLYLLAIGVSNYGTKLPRLQYGAQDAEDFAAVYEEQRGRLFDQVYSEALTDAQATGSRIREALRRLTEQPIKESDYVVLFIAGHGLIGVSDGQPSDYYFAPADCDPRQLMRTGISWDVLRNALKVLRAKVFLVLDTCHAGVAGAGRLGLNIEDTVNGVLRESQAQVGVVTLTACAPHEQSREDPQWGNGAFTHALVAALRGAGDSGDPPNQEVSVEEAWNYVRRWVAAHAQGQHVPWPGGTNTLAPELAMTRLKSRADAAPASASTAGPSADSPRIPSGGQSP
jgi:WD40 repeat protein